MEVIPIKTTRMETPFNLCEIIENSVNCNNEYLQKNDILVVSGKFVSMSQGSIVKLDSIKTTAQSTALGRKYHIDPRLAQLVIMEADYIFNGIEGFILAIKDGIISPNAGIDSSNIQKGHVILHPRKPFEVARGIRNYFAKKNISIGVVISDSGLLPTRIGTIGIALGVAGFEPVASYKGKKDLFGNTLKVTSTAIADGIATAANMLMGESAESIPIIIVRRLNIKTTERNLHSRDLAMPHEECLYVKGLNKSR